MIYAPTETDIVRFLAKVDKNGPLSVLRPELGRCWLWIGHRTRDGYGQFWMNGKVTTAHRASYEMFVGPIDPPSLKADHLCRYPPCVNFGHVEPVTNHENLLRGVAGDLSRRSHCRAGHEFTPDNTIRGANRGRSCRACRDSYNAAYMPDYYRRNRERWLRHS